jgi:hypothetical protein
MKSEYKPVKCIGWVGRIFGHKFRTIDRYLDHCSRCGMPEGGWK